MPRPRHLSAALVMSSGSRDISNFFRRMVTDPSTALGMTERRRDPGISFSAHESLRPSREYGLKIRILFFPRNHANIDVLEAGVFQKLVQLHFAETEPVISVKFTRPLEGMVQQIENHNPPILS